MKKTLLAAGVLLALISCKKTDRAAEPESETAVAKIEARSCASDEVLQAQIAADPSFASRLENLESFTRTFVRNKAAGRVESTLATINIPVVVHVVYNTSAQNISDAQVQSQIDVLNEDFNLQNSDNTLVPTHFSTVKANVGINFTVATDGVVCLFSAFGRTGTLTANYNKGRTTTHEVGHWANLRHIWGDATCGNDFVGDTPQHNTSNGGCPAADHRSTCTGTPLEMWMNYMDYTYDACMYMFSNGQKDSMLAVFAPGGPRASMVN